MKELALQNLRKEIDELDRKIQELIILRSKIAKKIGEIKQKNQRETNYFRPEREAEILQKIIERNAGPLSDKALITIFKEIIFACRALQESSQS